jgi:tetratricopeptide (TPR) repeat protein
MLKADRGDIAGAIVLYEKSLAITESIGDIKGQAATLQNLAALKADRGDIAGAIALFEKSLAIKESIGNLQGKAMTLQWLGWLAATEQGDFETGLNYLEQSLEILQHIQSPEAENVRELIARVQQQAGKYYLKEIVFPFPFPFLP